MIFSQSFGERAADLLGDLAGLHLLGEERIKPACPLVDWYVKPHLDSPSFPNRDEAWADRLAASVDFPLYLLDDDSAIRVRGDKVNVVSTGRWRLAGDDGAEPAARKSEDTRGRQREDGGMAMHPDQLHVDAQTVR